MTLRTPISTLFPYTTLFRSPIKGVAPHKYGVLDAVFVAMIQHSSRAAQVDAVALLRSGAYVGDRRKMHRGVGALGAKDVFGRALSDIGVEHLDAHRRPGPPAPVDSEHAMPGGDQRPRHKTARLARNAGDKHLHYSASGRAGTASRAIFAWALAPPNTRRRSTLPCSISSAMRARTWST